MPIEDAKRTAREGNHVLVCVAAKAKPKVYKLVSVRRKGSLVTVRRLPWGHTVTGVAVSVLSSHCAMISCNCEVDLGLYLVGLATTQLCFFLPTNM